MTTPRAAPEPLRSDAAADLDLSDIMDDAAFDACPERRGSDSAKWNTYPAEVLPLWVADMDVTSPRAVTDALQSRIRHGVFGYGTEHNRLPEVVAARLAELYAWHVEPEAIVPIPGVMPGLNLACRLSETVAGAVAVQTPVYPPIRRLAAELGRKRVEIEYAYVNGRATIDWDRFGAGLSDGVETFVLCNPQNPTGRVLNRYELSTIAAQCLRRGVLICSDEIHADLVHEGYNHIPIAALDPEVAARTITLMAPSKTFNLAGLGCALAVIPNRQLRSRFKRARASLVPHVNILGSMAAVAAYSEGGTWLEQIRRQLFRQRQLLTDFVAQHLPDIRHYPPEGTYLGWLDCSAANLAQRPFEFFLREAGVALSDGALFGATTSHCVRINFGCSERTLLLALARMRDALRRFRDGQAQAAGAEDEAHCGGA
ncbi:MAG TPA: PatB family C-S lyase [Polyangiaceae bacterium]